MRFVLVALLVLALGGCSIKEKDPTLEQKCQSAKDIMATGLPVEEFKPDPVPPLPTDVIDPRGKQKGTDIQVAAVADAEPLELKSQLAKAVTERGWSSTAQEAAAGPEGEFTATYQGPNIHGDVTLLPCMDDALVVFNQQGK
ncbi:hypothetical protein JOF56_003435 [Kibdelosporangium banguiense]|uniref:Lipoprotein n=1 Tax=Kibdelosporangium banguiense TaxID=1365924 RepID=A0ABS4TF62_9PSEU|nr:hypothetical protein [Kibdelosporangium banguiense]MBP2323050.1 hypothetical protein [Kibdelosporangium banguiense]